MYDQYKIKQGENLESIARKFKTDIDMLKSINNLYYTDNLKAGYDIIVPLKIDDYYDYFTVEDGDTLYRIAEKYNINPELLSSLNGLDIDDYIYDNQEILVPKYDYSYYITQDGDTLSSISEKFKLDYTKLSNYNSTVYLLGGQIIAYPKNKA